MRVSHFDMKVTLNWLKQYVDFNGSAEELAERLTLLGMEVEGIRKITGDFDQIVVAQVVTREPHPNADRLSVCKVNDGAGENWLDAAYDDDTLIARLLARDERAFRWLVRQLHGMMLAFAIPTVYVFMRSQRGGTRFLTRTVDTTDTALLALIGTKLDRTHYTYDSERTKDAWYARDAVGLYLTPNDGASDDDHRKTVKRLSAFVTPFKPLPARLIWFLELGSGDFEPVVSDG